MNNREFIAEMASSMSMDAKDVQAMATALVEVLTQELEDGNEVVVHGFGNFEVKKRNERIISNPSTGKKMLVPPKLTPTFKQSNTYKNKIK